MIVTRNFSSFIFILIQNWSGLLPGVGSIGYYDANGNYSSLIRPGNADLNMTLALYAVANLAWLYFIFKYEGLRSIIVHIFGNKADKNEVGIYTFLDKDKNKQPTQEPKRWKE